MSSRRCSPTSIGLFACILCAAIAAGHAFATPVVPANFRVENAVTRVTFELPTCLAFFPDGALLVGEKRGRAYVVRGGVRSPAPAWSHEREVLNVGDLGLMSVAVDPRFATNRCVYFLYNVDPDSNDVDTEPHSFGRLVRYRMSVTDSNVVDESSRTILMGTGWRDGPLTTSQSHSVGALRWGEDGSLLVSVGDGARSSQADAGGLDSAAFGDDRADPARDIGAFRAQDLESLAGKILRVNPDNGLGYASNPHADGDLASARSRIWLRGFRNPFRFTVRPGTGATDSEAGRPGTLFVADVGWITWEEVNHAATGGLNFGWPCYEGSRAQSEYQQSTPAHHGCGTVGQTTSPALSWHHSDSTLSAPAGLRGNCSIAGATYSGTRYPMPFHNRLFIADFGANWLKVVTLDSAQQVVAIEDFGSDLGNPVDFASNPVTGNLNYVSLAAGKVFRIRYTGPSNTGPIPVASTNVASGAAPLAIAFSSAGTYSPIGLPFTLEWSFGDGSGSTDPNPSHVYGQPGIFDAVLTVSDVAGAENVDTVRVVVLGPTTFPTAAVLDDFNRADGPPGAPWIDPAGAFSIANDRVVHGGGTSSMVWGGSVYGPEQEAFMTLSLIAPSAPHHDLMLKVQGTSGDSGHIQVRYDPSYPRVTVATYAMTQGWVTRGEVVPFPPFRPMDRLGARVYSDGRIEVFLNADRIARFNASDWPHAREPGRIGIALAGGASPQIDDFGGGTVQVRFPTTPVLDDFERPDGTIGPNWYGDAGVHVDGGGLTHTGAVTSTVWHPNVFGPDQEAFVTLSAISPAASHHDLMLKVQGLLGDTGHLQIRYDATVPRVTVASYSVTAGWNGLGEINPVTPFDPGDRFGARALSNGTVEVYRNDTRLAAFAYDTWPHARDGGRIGLTLLGASLSLLDDFGGGDLAIGQNHPPIATITAPADGMFYAEGDTIELAGLGADPEDRADQLEYQWRIDVHHNTHTHPGYYVSSRARDMLIAENHDDGTGVFLEAQLRITDLEGLRDTAVVRLYPEVDLWPGAADVTPDTVVTAGHATFRFTLHNAGQMPAPITHWVLSTESGTLAEGDTLVPGGDSVEVVRTISVGLAPGSWTARVTADSLGYSIETTEANNGAIRTIVVVPPPPLPARLALSLAYPSPARGMASFDLDLPQAARVSFVVYDVLGRRVWSPPDASYAAGRWRLSWPGVTSRGRRARAGIFLARIDAGGQRFMRRIPFLP